MCYLLPHFSRLPVLLNKVYRTLFSLYAKSAWQKKSAWEPGSPVPTYSTPLGGNLAFWPLAWFGGLKTSLICHFEPFLGPNELFQQFFYHMLCPMGPMYERIKNRNTLLLVGVLRSYTQTVVERKYIMRYIAMLWNIKW